MIGWRVDSVTDWDTNLDIIKFWKFKWNSTLFIVFYDCILNDKFYKADSAFFSGVRSLTSYRFYAHLE